MSIGRSNSINSASKPLPQITETKRRPLATSPIVNQLINDERKKHNLSISDCSCPICLEVLIEPVVLPCKHELCLPCFKDMMDQTNFLCPMCRMRLSTWARSASKHNALVDKERWSQIQRNFSTEIRNRMEGKTAEILSEEIKKFKEDPQSVKQIVSAQGEIKKEYEDLVRLEQERIRLEKEKEESLSLQLIQEIIQREEAVSFNHYLRVLGANTPGTIIEQPATILEQPATILEQPATILEQPATILEQPATILEQPATTSNSNPTTSVVSTSEATITDESIINQPFITPSVPTRALSNRLLNRVKSSLSDVNSNSSPTNATGSNTPVYSLRPRASIKRNLDQVATLRSSLNNRLKETEQPEGKRSNLRKQTPNSSIDSISLDNSIDTNTDLNINVDSKLPVTTLIRRKSTRVGGRK